jgi:hypothetical protein
MPENGETNTKFGVYRTLCCGSEIVIVEYMTFPDCPNHPKLTTVWKPLVTDTIIHLPDKKKSNPAA